MECTKNNLKSAVWITRETCSIPNLLLQVRAQKIIAIYTNGPREVPLAEPLRAVWGERSGKAPAEIPTKEQIQPGALQNHRSIKKVPETYNLAKPFGTANHPFYLQICTAFFKSRHGETPLHTHGPLPCPSNMLELPLGNSTQL